ncbi:MAG TPA: 50S ribosomal protein L31 [Patescibacteria group bacterium]
MQTKIHPKWYPEAKVTCACGNTFTIGATMPAISVEICSNCHPFYTGQMKYLGVAGRVDAFRAKQKGASKKVLSKSARREEKRKKRLEADLERPESLAQLRKKTSH